MKDFGRTDYYAPESDLDTDISALVAYEIQDGRICEVGVNDFLDLDASQIPEDPLWGLSFQVFELSDSYVIVRMYNATTDLYEPIAIDTKLITNIYRRVKAING